MDNISKNNKADKVHLQEWMHAVTLALEYIPAGHQVDLARQIIETHYPHMPDLSFEADRGDIMLWVASQEAGALSAVLDEITLELGQRRVSEMQNKRMLKVAWTGLSASAKQSFLEWAKGEQDGQQ